jgi:hypothetical protein
MELFHKLNKVQPYDSTRVNQALLSEHEKGGFVFRQPEAHCRMLDGDFVILQRAAPVMLGRLGAQSPCQDCRGCGIKDKWQKFVQGHHNLEDGYVHTVEGRYPSRSR